MILWTSKVTSETEPAIPRLGLRSWRWALDVNRWAVEAEQQMQRNGGEWHSANDYARIDITKRWHVGMEHYYHDGPHCQLSIGWLHIGWSLWWCEKCMPEEKT